MLELEFTLFSLPFKSNLWIFLRYLQYTTRISYCIWNIYNKQWRNNTHVRVRTILSDELFFIQFKLISSIENNIWDVWNVLRKSVCLLSQITITYTAGSRKHRIHSDECKNGTRTRMLSPKGLESLLLFMWAKQKRQTNI